MGREQAAIAIGIVSAKASGAVPLDTGRVFPRHGGEGEGRRAQSRAHRLKFAPDSGIRLPSRILSLREPILRLSARPDPTGPGCGRVAIGRRRQVRVRWVVFVTFRPTLLGGRGRCGRSVR
jgi:hypothetical protein